MSASLTTKNPHVNIVLSTYNGERYLAQLLESLYAQSHQNFSLWIRDDGSVDGTLAILKKYATVNANLTLIEGKNIGISQSFLAILAHCPTDSAQFYAFCDQDDVWKPEKLVQALSKLMATKAPATSLYCSRLEYVDSQLVHLGYSMIPTDFGFENALVENVAIGCTIVFGGELKTKIQTANPENLMMHDWWAYLVASGFGAVLYDPDPTILYRQHAHNVVGWNKRLPTLLKKASGYLRNIVQEQQGLQCLKQAEYFLQTFQDLSQSKQTLIREFIGLRRKGNLLDCFRFLKKHGIQRNHPIENGVLMLTVLFKRH